MQFEYDPERLIDEVRKRPGIWDFNSVEYRMKRTKQQLWAEVVKELNVTTALVTKSDLRELELQLQKKWKSIRDCFMKYVANPTRSRRPYIYFKKLQFLLNGTEASAAAPQADPDSSDSDEVVKKRKWKLRKTCSLKVKHDQSDDEVVAEDNRDDYSMKDSDIDDDEVHPTPAKNPKNKTIDQFAFANVDAVLKGEDSDPDRLFLLSLLPHLKSVPEPIRLNVKMDLMQVLQNANYSVGRDHKLI